MTVPKRTLKKEQQDAKLAKAKKEKAKAKFKLRKVTPIPDKPNSYIVEHEVHDVPVPPPLDVPLPEEVLELDKVHEQPKQTWVEWWKSLW